MGFSSIFTLKHKSDFRKIGSKLNRTCLAKHEKAENEKSRRAFRRNEKRTEGEILPAHRTTHRMKNASFSLINHPKTLTISLFSSTPAGTVSLFNFWIWCKVFSSSVSSSLCHLLPHIEGTLFKETKSCRNKLPFVLLPQNLINTFWSIATPKFPPPSQTVFIFANPPLTPHRLSALFPWFAAYIGWLLWRSAGQYIGRRSSDFPDLSWKIALLIQGSRRWGEVSGQNWDWAVKKGAIWASVSYKIMVRKNLIWNESD